MAATRSRRSDLTQAEVKALLNYAPETGEFTWLARPVSSPFVAAWNTRWAGKVAGRLDRKTGAIGVSIFCKKYQAHRLAWLYVYGGWPELDPDHRDCNPANNRIDNLRAATAQQNQCNRGVFRKNSTGLKGVHFDLARGKFKATIVHSGRTINLGRFDTADAAHAAYRQTAEKLHGEFFRINRPV